MLYIMLMHITLGLSKVRLLYPNKNILVHYNLDGRYINSKHFV